MQSSRYFDGVMAVPDASARASDVLRRDTACVVVDEAGALLVFPAGEATTELLHFAIRHSCGLVHAAVPTARLDTLRVPDQPVLDVEQSDLHFTCAVDAVGVGTGISAHDRAFTLRTLASSETVAGDLVRPGHVLPVRCRTGRWSGVRTVWEFAVDLVAGAGHEPVAGVCRLVHDEGDVLNLDEAHEFADREGWDVLSHT